MSKKGWRNTNWVDGEIAASEFADVRLGKRLHDLLEQIGNAVGESIPMACQDWANTKAAYRFFSVCIRGRPPCADVTMS